MICDYCDEDRSTISYKGYELCSYCYERGITKIDMQIARDKKLGHTGSDMCGCSMCAAAADMDTTFAML